MEGIQPHSTPSFTALSSIPTGPVPARAQVSHLIQGEHPRRMGMGHRQVFAALPSNPAGNKPGREPSRSLLPLCPQPPRHSKGRACTETAAKEKELLLPQHRRLSSQPPVPQLPRPTQPVHHPDHGTPPHGTHPGLVTLQTPQRDSGNHRANLSGVGGTPGGRLHPSCWVGA